MKKLALCPGNCGKMVAACKEMAVYCFDALMAHFSGSQLPDPSFSGGHHPLFVTWKKVLSNGDTRLRGCIGTLEPRCVLQGFKDYALISALQDRRFNPIQLREVTCLQVTVSLLTDFETAPSYLDWEIGTHGIIIEFTDNHNVKRSATYLPEVPKQEGWTKVETINSLIKKAGYSGNVTDALRRRLKLTRYKSSLFTLHYTEYVAYCQETRGKDLVRVDGAVLSVYS